jgi:hypothetical protein
MSIVGGPRVGDYWRCPSRILSAGVTGTPGRSLSPARCRKDLDRKFGAAGDASADRCEFLSGERRTKGTFYFSRAQRRQQHSDEAPPTRSLVTLEMEK